MTHRRAALILIACTVIWGASFSLLKEALGFGSPLALLAIRLLLASALLAAVLRRATAADWRAGALLGGLFWLQLATLNRGLVSTTPSRSAFILSLSVPLVPLIQFVADRARPRWEELAAVGLAVLGTGLVAQPGGTSGRVLEGDLFTLGSAVVCGGYLVAVGHSSRRHEPLRLLAVQLLVMGTLSLALSPVLESPRVTPTPRLAALLGLLALSSIATFGGQLVGQRQVRAAQAALIFALEPLVAAAVSYLTLGERLSPAQWLGGGCIIVAMLAVRR